MSEKLTSTASKSTKKALQTSPKKPSKPRQKTLDLKGVKKLSEAVSKRSNYIVDEETNLVIKYNKIFDENKIENVLKLAYEHLLYAETEGYDFFSGEDVDEKFMKYLHYLMIAEFTNLGDDIPNDFESHTDIFAQLISTGLFRLCLADIFDGNEIMKVLDRVEELASLVSKIEDAEKKAQKEVNEKVVNKEVLTAFKNASVIHPLINPNGIA